MRHLLSPLDFSVEETNELLDLAADIEKNPDKYTDICKGKKLLPFFMNQVPEQDSALKLRCLILAVMSSVFQMPIPVPHPKGKALQIPSA